MDHSRLPSGSGASTSKKRRPAAGLHTGLLVGDGETDDDELPPRVKILGEGEESDPEKDSDMSDLEVGSFSLFNRRDWTLRPTGYSFPFEVVG